MRVDSLLDILYPPKCALCGLFHSDSLCESCINEMIPYDPLTTAFPSHNLIQSLTNIFVYTGRAAQAIGLLKYSRITSLASPLSNLILNKLLEEGLYQNCIITAVPLHYKKNHSRGFNQSELLCCSLKEKKELNISFDIIKRTKDSLPKAANSVHTRKYESCNPFICSKKLNGEDILVIDDVYTTGYTSNMCAEALKKSGSGDVHILTFARS